MKGVVDLSSRRKGWKRMVTKVTFVGENFTRKPPKFERFIRPMGLRFKKAHVTHPELKVGVFCAPYCSRGGRRILFKLLGAFLMSLVQAV